METYYLITQKQLTKLWLVMDKEYKPQVMTTEEVATAIKQKTITFKDAAKLGDNDLMLFARLGRLVIIAVPKGGE